MILKVLQNFVSNGRKLFGHWSMVIQIYIILMMIMIDFLWMKRQVK
nr:MAG TPA: hypothetical protein [Inoviridae sp.]DAY39191.1 MAG TPA: hypothetical protein [Inoviridae sp.]